MSFTDDIESPVWESALDDFSENIFRFPDDIESPVWDRKTIPVTAKNHPLDETEKSDSKWIYGLKGEMLVVRAQNIYSVGSSTSHRITKSLYGCRWTVDYYYGKFDVRSDWKWVGKSSVTIVNNSDDFVKKGFKWLEAKLQSALPNSERSPNLDSPLWIFVEQQNEDYDDRAGNIQCTIATEFKWFLESSRPCFVVPIEYGAIEQDKDRKKDGANKDGANKDEAHKDGAHKDGAHKDGAHKDGAHKHGAHKDGAHKDGKAKGADQTVFDRSGFKVLYDVYQNPAATACSKTCNILKKWEPSLPATERPLKWNISIYADQNDYDDLEFPVRKLKLKTACVADIALLAAFNLNAEKCQPRRVLKIVIDRAGHSIDLIQKDGHAQKQQDGHAQKQQDGHAQKQTDGHTQKQKDGHAQKESKNVEDGQSQSGALQLFYFKKDLEILKMKYAKLHRNARLSTQIAMDKILAQAPNNQFDPEPWRRTNELFKIKSKIDRLIKRVNLQDQEYVVQRLAKAEGDPESFWEDILEFLLNPVAHREKNIRIQKHFLQFR
jgi:hypothetical protein